MNALIVALMTWITATTGLPATDVLPGISFATQEEIHIILETEKDDINDIIALYLKDINTIVLNENWDKDSAKDVSTLVHELVHFMSDVNGIPYSCRGESEGAAYDAQKLYLEEQGKSLFTEFDINGLYLMIVTSCPSGPFR